VDLFEYQAKELFAEFGVPVPAGRVAASPDAARAVAEELGGRVVVKAQVKTGGRGKAGGVQLADGPDQAEQRAREILGMDIRGHVVHRVLVEQASEIAEEFYASFLVDRADRGYLAMLSRAGGMDIEEVAATRPDDLARIPVDVATGVDLSTAERFCDQAGLPSAARAGASEILTQLYRAFTAADATLVEVNPLILTTDGRVVALDAKVTLDDNARFRHPEFSGFDDPAATDPLEQQAREKQLNYVKLDGQVGIIGNGAGLVMSTLDVVAYAGEEFGGVRPANFLDVGGGASAEVMANGLQIVLSDPSVRSVFINIFGGITQCDEVARGVVTAVQMVEKEGGQVRTPLVVRLDGNKAAEGRRILQDAGLAAVHPVDTMDGAARLAAELAAGAPAGLD
jgi:succinyl-CoA synthetase beta subunit